VEKIITRIVLHPCDGHPQDQQEEGRRKDIFSEDLKKNPSPPLLPSSCGFGGRLSFGSDQSHLL
jgi:hypothetical protein